MCSLQFPLSGLPLSLKTLTKEEVMQLMHKIANKLLAVKGKLINKSERMRLVNMVLSSIPTHHLTVFAMKKWAVKKVDKIRMNFFLQRGRECKSHLLFVG
jgi:O-succinylbenzoate synthase